MLNDKIFLAGHKGLVGSSVLKILKKKKFKKIIVIDKSDLDLRKNEKVNNFFLKQKPKHVIICAAIVGGIKDNHDRCAEYIYDNLQIQNNLIHYSYINNVKNLIFLGSSCIYPKFAKQPIKEDYLLSDFLEKSNEAYAIAKIAGVKLCEYYNKQYGTNYISLMPCNTFGPNDNYNLGSSHFLPAIIRKVHEAILNKKKEIYLWGNKNTKREIIFVEDLAEAIVYFLFKKTSYNLINIGTMKEYTIETFARKIMKAYEVNLKIKYINKNIVGTPRKILDCTLAKKLGWVSRHDIDKSILLTVNEFKKNYKNYI